MSGTLNNVGVYPVTSSNVAAVGYALYDEALIVLYKNGRKYAYPGVSYVAAEAIFRSKSVGKGVIATVAGKPCIKL